jgi:hypothetical protein
MRIDPSFDVVANRYLESLTHLRSANRHALPVCRICLGPTRTKKDSSEHWEICWPCREHRTSADIRPGELADTVGFIIYALENKDGSTDQSLRDMYQYKQIQPGQSINREISEPGQRIRTLLYTALRDNLPILAQAVSPVEVITHVPSTNNSPGRDRRALASALDSALSHISDIAPHQRLLESSDNSTGSSRTISPDRFSVTDPAEIAGRHVLLVEDTWVTGASVQSAAVSLHRAGAHQVTVMCIARMLKAKWGDGAYLASQYDTLSPPRQDNAVFNH